MSTKDDVPRCHSTHRSLLAPVFVCSVWLQESYFCLLAWQSFEPQGKNESRCHYPFSCPQMTMLFAIECFAYHRSAKKFHEYLFRSWQILGGSKCHLKQMNAVIPPVDIFWSDKDRSILELFHHWPECFAPTLSWTLPRRWRRLQGLTLEHLLHGLGKDEGCCRVLLWN